MKHKKTEQFTKNTPNKVQNDIKNESVSICACLMHSPLFRLIYQPFLLIEHVLIREIAYQPISLDSDKNNDSGLDCSGQGECQPNIENSDGDTMQRYLVKANRQKKVCKRRTSTQKRQKKVQE